MIIKVSGMNFEKEVLESYGPVLVNFWHYGNSQCRHMKQRFQNLKNLENCPYVVAEVDWQREKQLAEKYRVFGIPALLIFLQGKVVARYSGVVSSAELLKSIRGEQVSASHVDVRQQVV